MGFIIFVTIASLIVIAGHILLYFSWVHFLRLSNPVSLRFLQIALGLLSVSFIGSSTLAHWRENFLTSVIYYVASVWLGLILYLFLATIIIWLLAALNLIPGIQINIRLISTLLLGLALTFAAYGIWNASNPKIKRIEVNIENLPESWHGRRAVQISDVHLGIIHRRKFLENIVAKINRADPDIVFITGDLFDGEGEFLNQITEPLSSIKAPLGAYFVTGNHETYLGVDKALNALADKSVTVLRNQIVEIDGVQLVGIDYPAFGASLQIEPIMSRLDRSRPNIVLFHSPINIGEFKARGTDLQLSGHTHKGQLWPLNYISSAVYNGLDDGLYSDGEYSLYTSVGTGTWGPPMRIGNTPEITLIIFK